MSNTLALTPPQFYNTTNALAIANLQHSSEILSHGHMITSGGVSLGSSYKPIQELTQGWDEILSLKSPQRNIAPLQRDPATGMIIGQTDMFQRAIIFSKGLKEDLKQVCASSAGKVSCTATATAGSFLASFLPDYPVVNSAISKLSQMVGYTARISGDEYVLANEYSELLALARTTDAEIGNAIGAWNNAMNQLGSLVEDLQVLNDYKLHICSIFLLLFTVFMVSVYLPTFEEDEDIGLAEVAEEVVRVPSIYRGFAQGPDWELQSDEADLD